MNTNPVARLYDILERAQKHNKGHTVQQMWIFVLGTRDDTLKSVFLALTELIELADEAENVIKRLEGIDPSIRHEQFRRVRNVLSISNFDNQWNGYIGNLNQELMFFLVSVQILQKRIILKESLMKIVYSLSFSILRNYRRQSLIT